jgi:DICT domain-containing protein
MMLSEPAFSIYRMYENNHNQNYLLRHRRTMTQISHEIENAVIMAPAARTRVFSGFQRLSKFLPEMERYTSLAKRAESVYVFGIPDIEPPPIENIHYVRLTAADHLSREWFVIAAGTSYSSVLASEEISDFDDPDDQRVFKGSWIFNPLVVSLIADKVSQHVGAEPLEYTLTDTQHSQHARVMLHSVNRVMQNIASKDFDLLDEKLVILRNELALTVTQELMPAQLAVATERTNMLMTN